MRKRIRQLASGRFDYAGPKLSFSVDKIDIEVLEGKEYLSSFEISSTNHIPARGVIYSSNPRMECLTPQFEGEESRIKFQFHSEGLSEGDIQRGTFTIVCNQCEYSLSFCVSIYKSYPDAMTGKIRSLRDFARVAQEDWQEAYKLFYSKEFSALFQDDGKEALMYRGMLHARPSNMNVEEYLVGTHRKNQIYFSVNQADFLFDEFPESRKETIEITKDQWGYVEIEAEVSGSFIRVVKDHVTSENFIGSVCPFEFYLDKTKLHAGNNYGRILLKSAYQVIAIDITIKDKQERKEKAVSHEIKEYRAGIAELYEAYRLKRIVTGVWANESIEILDHLRVLEPDNPIYELMKAQALIINRQRQDAEWILNAFKRECTDHKTPTWGYYLYLLTLMEREPAYVDRITKEIEVIFHDNPDNAMLFWILLFLEDEYYNNSSRKLKAIEYWVNSGQNSPYLYLEAYYMFWQDPYLLSKLESFEVRIMRWAIRHKTLTKDLAAQIFELVVFEKEFSKVIYEIMAAAYEIVPTPENIGTICSYLIKAQKFEPEFHGWYEKGIELELRITGLYEAFLLSLDSRDIVRLPKIIQMYFQYESALPYKKMAVLYNNIIAAKDTEKEVYQKYRRTMGRFAMEQVEQEHIDDNLAVLYQDMLEIGLVNQDIAHSLAHILFTNKLVVFDTRMVRAIVYQSQLKNPQIVPIQNGETYVQLYSKQYAVLFEDANGHRYAGSVNYRIQPLMNPQNYLEKCMSLAPDELPYIICRMENCNKHTDWEQDDSKYFPAVLYSDQLSCNYQSQLTVEIIQFYKIQNEEKLIKAFLDQADPLTYTSETRNELLELLVEEGFYEKVYSLLETVGIDQISASARVALSSYMIDKYTYELDDFLLNLVTYTFSTDKYNDVMLIYLCKYLNSSTAQMLKLWKVAGEYGIDTFDLEERILEQLMFTRQYPKEADELFVRYQQNGGRDMIILAYLSARAYTYLVEQKEVASDIFEVLSARYLYQKETNDACQLALLKYLAETGRHEGTNYKIEDELLAEYTRRNMYFAFYKKVDKELILKYHLYDKVFIEYYTDPKKRVILHYSSDEDGEEFVTEEMTNVFDGIFVKSFVMFFGELIQYYFSEEGENQIKVSETERITNSDVYSEKDVSRYNLINQMLISNTLQDEEMLQRNMKQYKELEQITKKGFDIL